MDGWVAGRGPRSVTTRFSRSQQEQESETEQATYPSPNIGVGSTGRQDGGIDESESDATTTEICA